VPNQRLFLKEWLSSLLSLFSRSRYAGCATLAADCSLALYDCRTLLLDSLFALAQDEWPQVASAAKEWLQEERKRPLGHLEGRAMPDQGVLVSPALATAEASLQTWLAELPAALRRGDEAGRVHALKVVTCLQVRK